MERMARTEGVKLNGSTLFSPDIVSFAFSMNAYCFEGGASAICLGNISSMNKSSIRRQYSSTNLLTV